MDIYDLYDDNGVPVDECVPRNTPLPRNRNILNVHIYIRDRNGMYLIQKRSMRKELFPGLWDVTMGAVKRGETAQAGALRETREEVGLSLKAEQLEYLGRQLHHPALWDVWLAQADFVKGDLKLQATEVDDVRLVTKKEMLRIFEEQGHRPKDYLNMLEELLPE